MNSEWLLRLSQFNRLIVGFSGGLDSTVLLHVVASLPPLREKLVAVHVNHGIHTNAFLWQEHCKQFCHDLNVCFMAQSVQFDRSANIEEGARIARYSVFSHLMSVEDCLILGHHLNDQAETVLLQLFRGAGVDGLAAMPEFTQFGLGWLARPFLHHSREQLEHYASLHQLNWVEDESNCDTTYSRNYVRQEIIPLLKSKWPGVVGNIARTATHCQQAKRNLNRLAASDLSLSESNSSAVNITTEDKNQDLLMSNALPVELLHHLNVDRITNILRVWLKNNQIQLPSAVTFQRLIHEVIFASQDASPLVSWGNFLVRRYQNYLYLDKKNSNYLLSCIEWSEFPLPLNINGLAVQLMAKKASKGLVIPQNVKIFIRFRQGGEEFFWHGQTKRLKKLFQEWKVPPWLREKTPLIYFDNTLAAVVGYAMSDLFFTQDSAKAWDFQQLTL